MTIVKLSIMMSGKGHYPKGKTNLRCLIKRRLLEMELGLRLKFRFELGSELRLESRSKLGKGPRFELG